MKKYDQCFHLEPKNRLLLLFLSYIFVAVGAGIPLTVSQKLGWILEQVPRIGIKLELWRKAKDKTRRW